MNPTVMNRRGPNRPNGPACDVKTGSVSSVHVAVRIRKVACPMKVMATCPGPTLAGPAASLGGPRHLPQMSVDVQAQQRD